MNEGWNVAKPHAARKEVMATAKNFRFRSSLIFRQTAFLALIFSVLIPPVVRAGAKPTSKSSAEIYLRVELNFRLKLSHLKPGNVVEGRLTNDVYSGDLELFSAGSRVRLDVEKLGRRRRVPSDHWPWVVKIFTPRHEAYPIFQSAHILLPDGAEANLPVSMLSLRMEKDVRIRVGAKKKRKASSTKGTVGNNPPANPGVSHSQNSTGNMKTEKARLILTLESGAPSSEESRGLQAENSPPLRAPARPFTLGAGTQVQVMLLTQVSASKNRAGDVFRARSVEPIWLNHRIVLPEGTLIEGKVQQRTPPRMLSRPGSLQLVFSRLVLPGGPPLPVEASITAAELDRRSHTRVSPEGKLQAAYPGKVWMLINLGTTGGIAKETDDGLQLIVEAIVSTATDASTAGVARIAGSCASGLFLLTRHGRDVVLPRFTQMTIMFDRPVQFGPSPASAPVSVSGK
jgi:hypothetical protein